MNYAISLEPERTVLNVVMLSETRDKVQEQGINAENSRDNTMHVHASDSKLTEAGSAKLCANGAKYYHDEQIMAIMTKRNCTIWHYKA